MINRVLAFLRLLDNRRFWNRYYRAHPDPGPPSPFALYCAEHCLRPGLEVLELGCGNGRDTVRSGPQQFGSQKLLHQRHDEHHRRSDLPACSPECREAVMARMLPPGSQSMKASDGIPQQLATARRCRQGAG